MKFNKEVSFGERRKQSVPGVHIGKKRDNRANNLADGVMEMTWVPSANSTADDENDSDVGGMSQHHQQRHGKAKKPKGIETFGAGMEKGRLPEETNLDQASRSGRTKRRTGVRSGSRNVFRQLS